MSVPFGISSFNRQLPEIDGGPFEVASSAGARLVAGDGRDYVDYCMALGANLLGHADPDVVEEAIAALRNGSMPGFRHAAEQRAGAALARIGGRLDNVTFVTTGSEAIHLACQIARARTGRRLIAKAVGGYNGWFEDQRIGMSSTGEAADRRERAQRFDMTIFRINEPDDIDQLFAAHGDELAAVLVEPMLGNGGLVPNTAFLKHLRALADRHGVMVVADEILVGLRDGLHLMSEKHGLRPDLATMGKAIGTGLPVAAVLGTNDAFAPILDGSLRRYGTYHGNPLVTRAVCRTLETLAQRDYASLFAYGARLRRSLVDAFAAEGVEVATSGLDSVFSLWFVPDAPATYDQGVAGLREKAADAFHIAMRRHGVMVLPRSWSRMFVSFAHGEGEMARTLEALPSAAAAVARALRDA